MSRARSVLPWLADGLVASRRTPLPSGSSYRSTITNRSFSSVVRTSILERTRLQGPAAVPRLPSGLSITAASTRSASSLTPPSTDVAESSSPVPHSQPPSWTSTAIQKTFATSPLGFILKYATGRSSFDVSSFRRSSAQSSRNAYRSSGSGGGRGGGGGSGWWTNFKNRLDGIPPMRVVYGLIGINVGVFLLWQYALTSWQRFRDPSLYYWMTNNFIVSEANLMAGRIYTLLTCCFSHSSGTHIMLNMLGLYFIAPATVGVLGTANFLGLYLGAGIISSLVSLAWHRAANRGRRTTHGSEGASGAIYACLSFFAATFPQTQFLMFFVIPMPAWVAVGGIFAYDLYTSIASPWAKTDSAGHIGGMAAGIAYALLRRGRGGRPRSPFGY